MSKQEKVYKLEAVLQAVYNQLKEQVLGSVVVFARRHTGAQFVSDAGKWPLPPGDYILIRIPQMPTAPGKLPVAATFAVTEISTPAQRGEQPIQPAKDDQKVTEVAVAVPAGA